MKLNAFQCTTVQFQMGNPTTSERMIRWFGGVEHAVHMQKLCEVCEH